MVKPIFAILVKSIRGLWDWAESERTRDEAVRTGERLSKLNPGKEVWALETVKSFFTPVEGRSISSMNPVEINRSIDSQVLGQERFPGIPPRDEDLVRKGRMRGWAALLRTPTGREITFIPACRWRLEEGGFLGSRVYEDVEEFIGIVGEQVAEDVLEKGAIIEVEVPAGEHLSFVGLCRAKAPARVETRDLELLLFEG